jgi:hypothetical protein
VFSESRTEYLKNLLIKSAAEEAKKTNYLISRTTGTTAITATQSTTAKQAQAITTRTQTHAII